MPIFFTSQVCLEKMQDLQLALVISRLYESEFEIASTYKKILQRHLLIKIRVLSGQLRKENKEYDTAFQSIVKSALFAAEHFRETNAEDMEQKFETTAQTLVENVKSATSKVEDCLNYIRDPRARSNLRSINDHLSFQISDIISRARLILQTHYVCDTLSLDVQIQCWSAKAHYVVEEIRKQDGIHQEAKEHIKAGLQGRDPGDTNKLLTVTSSRIKEVQFPDTMIVLLQKDNTETIDAAAACVNIAAVAKHEPETLKKDVGILRFTRF